MKLSMLRLSEIIITGLMLAIGGVLLFIATDPIQAQSLAQSLSGKILLQVEDNGEAWYVNPESKERYFLGRPNDAFELMRTLGLGVSNENIQLIAEAGSSDSGNKTFAKQLSGKILLQVEENGEAWYVNPDDLKRYFLGRPKDAFALMRQLGLGISTENLISIPVAIDSKIPETNTNKSNGSSTEGQIGDMHVADRATVLASMNTERSLLGLADYKLVQELSKAAQAQANDMTTKNYFDFTSPSGQTITSFLTQTNYVAHTVAQNLVQTNKGAGSLVTVWKNEKNVSFTNVVHEQYKDIGVGIGEFEGFPIYVVVFAISLDDFFTHETESLQDLGQVQSEMLARLNEERINEGFAPLVLSTLLNKAAQNHTNDMLNRSYYAHESPEGLTSHDRIKAVGYVPSFTGENIAKGQFSVQEVMDSWMDSPAHRANIMSPNFTQVGFGLSFGANQNGFEIIWGQNFGRPM